MMNMMPRSNVLHTDILDVNTVNFYKQLRKWMSSPTSSFFQETGKVLTTPYRYQISAKTEICEAVAGEIILIQQFYLPTDKKREEEIKQCLKFNNHNTSIDKIILLNEREYTTAELGISSSKITQVVVSNRLTYQHVFEYAQQLGNDKYIVLANADIFFDATLKRIRISGLTKQQKIFSLLRYEYETGIALKNCKLFGPRPDSQDTWIWHTKWTISSKILKLLNMQMGIPGCDNKIIYLLNIIGFACYNEPQLIKTYHNHKTCIRNYNGSTVKASNPYYAIFPVLLNEPLANINQTFDIIRENNELYNYLVIKFKENKSFIIPRIAGIENEVAMFGAVCQQTGKVESDKLDNFKVVLPVMKKNAGILLEDMDDIITYSKAYLDAFHKCERYAWWEPWGEVVKYIPRSFDFVILNFSKLKFDSLAFDIFHSIQNNPWTLALRGKRILIISAFIESIKEKIPIREKIYGIDLFPDCKFVFLKPPQTHGSNKSQKFYIEYKEFIKRIEDIKDTFDIALCSCGGYGNPICAAIYDMGKSAIYVGGVLQMYFGIYGQRWLRERPDIMRLYLNKHWTRPKEKERPDNYKDVEKSCYW